MAAREIDVSSVKRSFHLKHYEYFKLLMARNGLLSADFAVKKMLSLSLSLSVSLSLSLSLSASNGDYTTACYL